MAKPAPSLWGMFLAVRVNVVSLVHKMSNWVRSHLHEKNAVNCVILFAIEGEIRPKTRPLVKGSTQKPFNGGKSVALGMDPRGRSEIDATGKPQIVAQDANRGGALDRPIPTLTI